MQKSQNTTILILFTSQVKHSDCLRACYGVLNWYECQTRACSGAEEPVDRQEGSDLNCDLAISSAPLLFHWMVSRARASSRGRPLLLVLLPMAGVSNWFPSFSLLLGMNFKSGILYRAWLDYLFLFFLKNRLINTPELQFSPSLRDWELARDFFTHCFPDVGWGLSRSMC